MPALVRSQLPLLLKPKKAEASPERSAEGAPRPEQQQEQRELPRRAPVQPAERLPDLGQRRAAVLPEQPRQASPRPRPLPAAPR